MPEIWPVLFCHNQKGKIQEKSLILTNESELNCVREHVLPLSWAHLFPTPWTVFCQAPLPMGLSRSRQEYWSGLSSPPPGYLPDPGTELSVLCLPH